MNTFDPKKPVKRRNGTPVRIVCTDAKGPYPIIGLGTDPTDTEEFPLRWTAKGEAMLGGNALKEYDLINVPPEPVVLYANVYKSAFCGRYYLGDPCDTPEECITRRERKHNSMKRIAAIAEIKFIPED